VRGESVGQLLVPDPAGVVERHLVVDPFRFEEIDHLSRADECPVVLGMLPGHHEAQRRPPRLTHEVDPVLIELATQVCGDCLPVGEIGVEGEVLGGDRPERFSGTRLFPHHHDIVAFQGGEVVASRREMGTPGPAGQEQQDGFGAVLPPDGQPFGASVDLHGSQF